MTTKPAGRAAADRATSDPTPLVSTPTTADHVTAREIVEFLRDLAELRAGTRGDTGCDDPAERAAFLARKAELFTRLAADTPATTAPERRTP